MTKMNFNIPLIASDLLFSYINTTAVNRVDYRAVCRFLERGCGGGSGHVEDCGLVFPGADPGFPVIGGAMKKFRGVERGAKIFGVFCVKNQDFMQKIIFFPILVGVRPLPP